MWLQAGEWGGGVHYTEAGWQGCDTYSENKEMLGPVQWHDFRDGDDAPSVCLSVCLSAGRSVCTPLSPDSVISTGTLNGLQTHLKIPR